MDLKILKKRRKEIGYTLKEVAAKIGVTEATVQRWESGNIKTLRDGRLMKLAEILEISPQSLMGWDDLDPAKYPQPVITENYVTFPVIGEVAAGYDYPALEDWEGEVIDIPLSHLKGHSREEFFVLRVKGDSMYPDYQDGDRVLVLRQSTLNYSGQVGVVLYDDELATLKRVEYKQDEDWMRFIAINPAVPPKTIRGEALEHCKVLGIPKLLIRNIND